jgi:hypothetical protein
MSCKDLLFIKLATEETLRSNGGAKDCWLRSIKLYCASAIMLGREKISSVIRKAPGPFFATISKRSDKHVSDARFPTPRALAPLVSIVDEPIVEAPLPAEPPVVAQAEEEPSLFEDEAKQNN